MTTKEDKKLYLLKKGKGGCVINSQDHLEFCLLAVTSNLSHL